MTNLNFKKGFCFNLKLLSFLPTSGLFYKDATHYYMIVITILTVYCESFRHMVVHVCCGAVLNCGENMNESEINSPEAGQLKQV